MFFFHYYFHADTPKNTYARCPSFSFGLCCSFRAWQRLVSISVCVNVSFFPWWPSESDSCHRLTMATVWDAQVAEKKRQRDDFFPPFVLSFLITKEFSPSPTDPLYVGSASSSPPLSSSPHSSPDDGKLNKFVRDERRISIEDWKQINKWKKKYGRKSPLHGGGTIYRETAAFSLLPSGPFVPLHPLCWVPPNERPNRRAFNQTHPSETKERCDPTTYAQRVNAPCTTCYCT